MRKLLFTLLVSLAALSVMAEKARRIAHPGGCYRLYRLELADKQGTPFSLSHPEAFLSAKALERRQKQHLAVDSTDLPLSPQYLEALSRDGLEVVGGSKWQNTVIVKTDQNTEPGRFDTIPFVKKSTCIYIAPDSITPDDYYPILLPEPTDTCATRYGLGQRQIEMLGGERLHEAGFRGKGVLIAVIDGGFMNMDRIAMLRDAHIIGTRDCVYPYDKDLYRLLEHGTMVLSCMAASADSLFVGTAPEASYLLLRSENGSTEQLAEEDWWVQAAEYADSVGADVINSSLGYNLFDHAEQNHLYREQDGQTALISRAASMLAGKGIVLVCSAGNEGNKSWKRIKFPADALDILSVAAVDSAAVNADFSSVGPSADGRVKPDVAAMGYDAAVIDGIGELHTANGTSFAAPIVCGLVACLRQAMPDATASHIMQLVRQSADRTDYPDNVYGYGIPNFWKAYQRHLNPSLDPHNQ